MAKKLAKTKTSLVKPQRKMIRKPVTLKQYLKVIETGLKQFAKTRHERDDRAVGGSRGNDLWDVLTALRGPDSGDCKLKESTTQRIRGVAFPGMAGMTHYQPPARFTFGTTEVDLRAESRQSDMSSHFRNHVREAARHLGLRILRDNL